MTEIHIQVERRYIHLINCIIEGYEYLGLVSTIDSVQGLLVVRVTPDTYEDVCCIIKNMPVPVRFV